MNEVFKFRKAGAGYKKQDVIAYITALVDEQNAIVDDYKTKLDRMKRDLAAAEERTAMAEAKADELATELYAAEHRETELKRAVMGLSERVRKFEQMRKEWTEKTAKSVKSVKTTLLKKGSKFTKK